MKLKTNINVWEISYKVDDLPISTIFNSGFIDDISIIEEYVRKSNSDLTEIRIKKFLQQNAK